MERHGDREFDDFSNVCLPTPEEERFQKPAAECFSEKKTSLLWSSQHPRTVAASWCVHLGAICNPCRLVWGQTLVQGTSPKWLRCPTNELFRHEGMAKQGFITFIWTKSGNAPIFTYFNADYAYVCYTPQPKLLCLLLLLATSQIGFVKLSQLTRCSFTDGTTRGRLAIMASQSVPIA